MRDIDVALAAKLAGIGLEDFRSLNPSVNKPVILAAGTPQVLLPWDSADDFQQNLQDFKGPQLASWTVWVAPSTLKAAEAAKKVGMSEEQLRAVNNIPARMLIKAGSTLLVPRSHNAQHDVTESIADRGQVSLAPEMVTVRKTVRAGKADTVATLAKRFNVSAANVAQWNKVAANAKLKPGQSVALFVTLPAGGQAKTVAAKKPAPKSKGGGKKVTSKKVAARKKA